MKKLIAIFVIVFFVGTVKTSFAQDLHWDASGGHGQQKFGPLMRGFYFGPVAGINISSLTQMSYAQARVRPTLGMSVGYQVSNLFGVHAEVLYSWQGAKMSNSGVKYTLNYLKIPFTARLNIIAGLGVEAGVAVDILAHSNLDAGNNEATMPISQNLNKADFTIPVGVYYLFARRIELNARYYISTVNVYKDNLLKAKNSTFSVTVKYRF